LGDQFKYINVKTIFKTELKKCYEFIKSFKTKFSAHFLPLSSELAPGPMLEKYQKYAGQISKRSFI